MKIKLLIFWLFIIACIPYLWGFGVIFNPAIGHQKNIQQKNKSSLSVQTVPERKVTQSKKRLNQHQITQLHINLLGEYIPRIEQQAHQLQIDAPKNQSIQKLVPIVFDLTTRALKESSMIKAYHLVDFASDLITLGKNLVKGTKAVIHGSMHGLKTVLTLAHYKEFAVGLAQAVKAGFTAMAQADELEDIMYCSDSQVTKALVIQHQATLNKEIIERAAQWKLLCDYYDKTSWDKLLEMGAEFGTALLFDAIVLNAAGWAVTETGKQLVAKLAQASVSESFVAELSIEVAGLGKIMVEQGEVEALKVIEKAGNLEEAMLKAGKNKPRIIELKPLQRTLTEVEIDEILSKSLDHIFSDKHKNGKIFKLGSTGDKNSISEILESVKRIIKRLSDEKKYVRGDNQIYTTINGCPVEIRIHFDIDENFEKINLFFRERENRMMDYRLVLQDNQYKEVLRKDDNVIAIRKND